MLILEEKYQLITDYTIIKKEEINLIYNKLKIKYINSIYLKKIFNTEKKWVFSKLISCKM